MKKIVYSLWIIGLFIMSLNAGDILVPYDDDGFYGGSIILIALFYIGIPLTIIWGIGGLIAYFVFPKIIKEFKTLIILYDTMEFRKALIKHSIHLLLFTPIVVIILYFTYVLFEVSYWYLFALFLFLYSSFFGFYVFLFFVMAIYLKNWKKILVALVLGGGIFFVFAPSGYFIFEPIYKIYHQKDIEKKIDNATK